jgi:putative ABC transport system substrate-binding protein
MQLRAHAAELVALRPEVILAGSTPVVTALRSETTSIPIVFVQVVDPVASGFVSSLARPGGNITGITNFETQVGSKWLQTLKELAPKTTRVAVLYNPKTAPYADLLSRSVSAAGPSFGIELTDSPFQDAWFFLTRARCCIET